jgi:hypothetical protein
MTQEDIIRMAREAGLELARFTIIDGSNKLKRFAALVAAAEREACAKLAENRSLADENKNKRIGHHHACKSIAIDIRTRGQA